MGEYTKLVTTILSLFIVIIACVMIFWSMSESIIETGTTDETFAGYAASANATAWTVELDDAPTGSGATNVTCYNATGGTESYPTFGLNGRTVSVAADAADEFTQVNVSYTSEKTESAGITNDMFTTIAPLLVLIGLVLVAGILIAGISKFGGG